MKFCFNPEQLLTLTFTLSLLSVPVQAQVLPDNTLGTTVTTPDGKTFTIEGGTTAGNNLFHSFAQLSLLTGQEAFFNNPVTISNIISRVTGGDISNLDGLIRASGSANLFLINPAGIIFGNNASLDIGGSFYGSTANSILFPNGVEFSATDTATEPILTINAPIGLNFRDNPQPITNQSTANGVGLQVDTGQNITLVGGNLNFSGGILTAPGGRVDLGGLSAAGEVGISENGSLTFPDGIARADVTLTDGASVDVTSGGGGFINVNANNLELNQESLLLAGIKEGLGSSNAIAGTININTNSILADNDSEIRSETEGIGKAGTVNINTNNLNFVDGSAIVVSTFGQGDAGTVNLNATNISFDREWGGIYSTVGLRRIETVEHATDAIGNGGTININTDNLSLTNGARILGNTIAQGNAGNIDINATGAISFVGQGVTLVPAFNGPVISGSFSQVREEALGSGGQVSIEADSLTLIDKGAVLVDNRGGEGDAGDITIEVQNKLFSDQIGLILSQVAEGGEGNGGDINITAGSFEATGGTFILADTKGQGNAGNININVKETFSLDKGSSILTEVGENAQGNGGAININANSVIIQNGARINSLTQGQGNAGNIAINADDSVLFDNDGAVLGQVSENAQGNGGFLDINTTSLILTKESQLSVDNQGQGQAGNILIDTNSLELNEQGKITANTRAGEGGNIDIQADNVLLQNNSLISAQAIGEANGGNVRIDSDFIVAFPAQNNDIIADAQQGNGGNIIIKAQSVFGIEEQRLDDLTNDINASSAKGAQFNGVIEIITPDVDPFQETAETPKNVVEQDRVVAGVCSATQTARVTGETNTLIVNGKGGVPPKPTEPFTADHILINGQSVLPNSEAEESKSPLAPLDKGGIQEQYPPIMTDQGPIYPARGIVKNPDGTVFLTAYPTNSIQRVPSHSLNCGFWK